MLSPFESFVLDTIKRFLIPQTNKQVKCKTFKQFPMLFLDTTFEEKLKTQFSPFSTRSTRHPRRLTYIQHNHRNSPVPKNKTIKRQNPNTSNVVKKVPLTCYVDNRVNPGSWKISCQPLPPKTSTLQSPEYYCYYCHSCNGVAAAVATFFLSLYSHQFDSDFL